MDSGTSNDNCKRSLEAESEEDVQKRIFFIGSNLEGLKRCRDNLSKKERDMLTADYQNIDALIDVVVDQEAIRAFIRYFDEESRCFVFPKVDLAPTLEEYHHLLDPYPCSPDIAMYVPDLSKGRLEKGPVKNDLEFHFGMKNSWARDSIHTLKGRPVIDWDGIYREMEEDDRNRKAKGRNDKMSRRRVEFLVMGIYGLILFPTVENRVDARVLYMVMSKSVKDIMHMALAETFWALVYLKTHRRGKFMCCAQLFTLWIHGRFSAREDWKYGNLACKGVEFVEMFNEPNRKMMNRIEWDKFLSDLENSKVTWSFPWKRNLKFYLAPSKEHNCVPLFGLFGAISYSPVMVMMQLGNEQGMPELGGVNAWNVKYDDRASTADTVNKMKEAWGQCRRKEGRLGEGLSREHQVWRSQWVDNRVMPKKPKNTLFYQFTQAEKDLKEKEQKIGDLEEQMSRLSFKLYKRRMVETELARVQKEHEQACKERDDWMIREMNAEERIESIVEGNKSHNIYLKGRSREADKLGRILPLKNQHIRRLEAKTEEYEESKEMMKRRVQWFQKKVEELEEDIKSCQRDLEKATREMDEAKESSGCYANLHELAVASRDTWKTRCERAEEQLRGQGAHELVTIIQELRRNAQRERYKEQNKAVEAVMRFPDTISQDDRVLKVLGNNPGLKTHVYQLMVKLKNMTREWMHACEDLSVLWVGIEDCITDLPEDVM